MADVLRKALEKIRDLAQANIDQGAKEAAIARIANEQLAALSTVLPPALKLASEDHTPPDRQAIEANRQKEPEGERIRAELEKFISRNGIVSVLLDTDKHEVRIDIRRLPSRIKNVLSLYGSIYVDDTKGGDAHCTRQSDRIGVSNSARSRVWLRAF
ncbi:MAG: hypothetical protein KGL39_25460 [Patescibacteria group bacterium]|nr:hypothetical protein [Patescibacteria group bacterium]